MTSGAKASGGRAATRSSVMAAKISQVRDILPECDEREVAQALLDTGGDVMAAVEALLEEQSLRPVPLRSRQGRKKPVSARASATDSSAAAVTASGRVGAAETPTPARSSTSAPRDGKAEAPARLQSARALKSSASSTQLQRRAGIPRGRLGWEQAIDALAGMWVGQKGETYEIDGTDWSCTKRDHTGEKRFRLDWDEASKSILWGTSYWFDTGDFASQPDVVTWYRGQDYSKTVKAFVWTREGLYSNGTPAMTRSKSVPPPPRDVAVPSSSSSMGGASQSQQQQSTRSAFMASSNAWTLWIQSMRPSETWKELVNPDETVGSVKKRIGASTLIFNDKILKDESKIDTVKGLRDGDMLVALIVRSTVQAAAPPSVSNGRSALQVAEQNDPDAPPDVGDPRFVGSIGDQLAIEGIAGKWKGEKGELYIIDEVGWECTRRQDGDNRPFSLDWDAVNQCVLWGSSYFFDPSDLAKKKRSISWYRSTDPGKRRKMFTWVRPKNFNLEEYLQAKLNGRKKQTKKQEEALIRKMEAEQLKFEAELETRKKASDEAKRVREAQRLRAEEVAREQAEQAQQRQEENMLARVEERKNMQLELEKRRAEQEAATKKEEARKKSMKLAALGAASANPKKALGEGNDLASQGAGSSKDEASLEDASRKLTEEMGRPRLLKAQGPDPRVTLNLIMMGSTDAGKSRMYGNLLFVAGAWDKHTLEKFQVEERDRVSSKQHGVRHATFGTTSRRFKLLDPPRLKDNATLMVAAVSQADVALMVVSARRTDFEASIERGSGQAWEHAVLAKAFGVEQIIVAVNRMDDPSVGWSQERFEDVRGKMTVLLRSLGLREASFVPVSNFTRNLLKDRQSDGAWFSGMTVIESLNSLEAPERGGGSARFAPLDVLKDKDGSAQVVGSIVQGILRPGAKCTAVPSQQECTIQALLSDMSELTHAAAGEFLTLRLAGIASGSLRQGELLCLGDPVRCVSKFKASLQVLESAHDRVITAGYKSVMHVHSAVEECELNKITEVVDLATKEKQNLKVLRPNTFVLCVITVRSPLPLASFTDMDHLGRFVLRADGQTIAIGKVTELAKERATGSGGGVRGPPP